ncbi:hypothetical protein KO481_28265 [Nocardia sp. NEAU-G5]|uniref:Uncharacterized protein n=1 Tax=Nocardia albiluteola TaxID=2842303 RepID=A0ABS6B7S2_9NOCA|nr:hypothetical protein [Nocardia albiluteola]MBU3065410.1 hypothetical protein [Nocardia albiluteola]
MNWSTVRRGLFAAGFAGMAVTGVLAVPALATAQAISLVPIVHADNAGDPNTGQSGPGNPGTPGSDPGNPGTPGAGPGNPGTPGT